MCNKVLKKLDASIFKKLPEESFWRVKFEKQRSELFTSIRQAIIDYKEDREKEIIKLYTFKKDSDMKAEKLHILDEIKMVLDYNFESIKSEINNHE